MVFESLTSLSQSIKSRQHTDNEHSNINKNTGRQNRKKTKKKQTENWTSEKKTVLKTQHALLSNQKIDEKKPATIENTNIG